MNGAQSRLRLAATMALVGLLIAGAWLINDLLEPPEPSVRDLPNLTSVDNLRQAFNVDVGVPRLILLLSPT